VANQSLEGPGNVIHKSPHPILTPLCTEALAYWNRLRRTSDIPARKSIDPAHMLNLMQNVLLFDVRHDPLDFRYRLVGGTVRYHLFDNPVGKVMSELSEKGRNSKIFNSFREAVETRQPVNREIPYIGPHKDYKRSCAVICPLSSDGEAVDQMFVVVEFLPK
jgi:hypothetical protein